MKKVIIGFPNFAYYRARLQIFFRGKTPVTGAMPYEWYETPNLHFLSVFDFLNYCHEQNINIERSEYIGKKKHVYLLPNIFAQVGIFLISK
ncbi:MAG: hypothetical protein HY934_06605 [Candidatus Firestonebacteria bacterium]|nr:hypothetical protein [Candidatus Firestonebacteria bacterium]